MVFTSYIASSCPSETSQNNWIRLKHDKKEKGPDTKFTLLSRKNMDNENGDKIQITINSGYQTEKVRDVEYFGEGNKTRK